MKQLSSDSLAYDPNAEIENEASENRFGMWLFLSMEMLFFGAFFMLFAAGFREHAADFKIASHHLNRAIAIGNTAILLTSSLCMAIAVLIEKHRMRNAPHSSETTVSPRLHSGAGGVWRSNSSRPWLLLSAIFGVAFLLLKLFEYHLDACDGILPYINYAPNFEAAPAVYLFYSLYFFVTLIHFVHLTIGCFWVSVLALKQKRPRSAGQIEVAGLYWHFVDMIWILLLPTLYLLQ